MIIRFEHGKEFSKKSWGGEVKDGSPVMEAYKGEQSRGVSRSFNPGYRRGHSACPAKGFTVRC